jgi:Ca2+-binding RTX toxin-like protein
VREEYDVHSTQITREPITSPPTSPTQTVTYSGLASVTVNGADASGDQYFALGTPAGTSVSLNAGSGGFNQFLAFDEFSPTDAPPATDFLLGPLAFHGHQPSDFGERVDSFDAAGHTFTLSAVGAVSTVQRDGAADLTYDGLSQMIMAVAPVGGNHVNVRSVAPGVYMNITLAAGDQAVVGSLAPLPGGTMEDILGPVAFTTETAGTATVTLVDTADTTVGRRVTIAPPPSATNPFSSIVGLSGAPDLGVYFLLNPGSSVAVHGGLRDKTFALLPGALPGVSLSIDGGGGSNTLDYSGWTGDIAVNLQQGTATGVDGGISNIRNVTGSIGNDLLVGDANLNVLIGGTGRNIIIGGGGPDQIVGGGGDNLLIGGTTDYDQNASALDLIMEEWLLPSDFGTRMAALQTGGDLLTGTGIELVTGSTVHPDGLATVTPGPGNNWIIQ